MTVRIGFLLSSLFVVFDATASEPAPVTAPAPIAWLDETRAGDVRMLAWASADGGRVYVQRLDARTHATIGEPTEISRVDQSVEEAWVITGGQRKPVIAANTTDGTFFVAWQAQLEASAVNMGTELVGRLVAPAQDGSAVTLGPLLRISNADGDTDPEAASDARSVPALSYNAKDHEFLVAWMHWPEGHGIVNIDGFTYSTNQPVIFGQRLDDGGERIGGAAILDNQPSPDAHSDTPEVERLDSDILHLSLSSLQDDQSGHMLLWSDASQIDNDTAMLFSKILPRDISLVVPASRTPITDSSSASTGIQRVALARVGTQGRYLSAFEDGAGTRQLLAAWLDSTGLGERPSGSTQPRFIVMDRITNEDRFWYPEVLAIPALDKVVVQAVIGNRGSGDGDSMTDGKLAYVTLADTASPDSGTVSDAHTVAAYPAPVTHHTAQFHALGDLPDGKGFFNAVVDADARTIRLIETTLTGIPPDSEPGDPAPSDPDDPGVPAGEGGGGAPGSFFLLAIAMVRFHRRSLQ